MEKVKAFIEKHSILTFWVVMVIQIGFVIFWGCMKSNFHQDELYSFQSAHYIGDSTPFNQYMHQTEIFNENVWLNVGDFKKYLIVNNDVSIFGDKISRFMFKLALGEPYDVILNIICVLFFSGTVSKWAGIIINIPCFILSQYCLWYLCNQISRRKVLSLLCISAYGFSSIAIGFGIYTRFYCYALMMILISLVLHYIIWINDNKIIRNLALEMIALFGFVQAFSCSELVAVIVAGWFFIFSISLLISKKWLQFITYVSPALAGAVYMMIKYNFLCAAILNPKDYMDGSGQPLDLMFTNASNITKRQVLRRTYNYFDFMGNSLFGSKWIFALLLIILFVLLVSWLYKVKMHDASFPVMSTRAAFFYMIVALCGIYSVFGFVVSLWLPRYYALIYPEVMLIIVVVFWYLLKNKKKIYNNMVMGIFLISILLTNILCNIDNVFLEDRDTLVRLESYDNCDSVIWNMDDYQIIMECVYQMSENSRMYVCSEYEPLEFEDFGDEYLLWTCQSEPLTEEVISMINDNGYEVVEHLGIAADANIYYCRVIE